MGAPVTLTLYCSTSSFSSSGFPSLSQTPSLVLSSSMGWNVGTNSPPLFGEMTASAELLNTNASWLSSPTASIPNNRRGNCFVGGPYRGEFLSGSWNITMSVKPVNNSNNNVGNMLYRFWKGFNISGSGASLITSTFYSSSRCVAQGGPSRAVSSLTSSNNLPNVVFRNEYLFIQTYWMIVTAGGGGGGGSTNDEDFVFGPTASFIITPSFVSDHPQNSVWYADGDD